MVGGRLLRIWAFEVSAYSKVGSLWDKYSKSNL